MQKFDFGYQQVSAAEKSQRVRNLFQSVAPGYDLMNDLMSLGVHRYWRQVFINQLNPRPSQLLLDVAGGSGDIAQRFLRHGGGRAILCDVSENMLNHGRDKAFNRAIFAKLDYVCGEAENLPIADNCVDNYSIAFGFRNVTERDKALTEAHRVLKRGGRFLCLEFCPQVSPLLEPAYRTYSSTIIPLLGELILGDAESYRYLAESIRKFLTPPQLLCMLESAGFDNCRYDLLSGGLVAIHSGWKI